jgi:hypothetical protein
MMLLLLSVVSPLAVLRDSTLSSEGTNEIQSGLPQVLIVLGILVLFLILAGTVFWRVRQSSRTRMK